MATRSFRTSTAASPGGDERSLSLRDDLRTIFSEGVAWSFMVGLGETYFPAFALALGMGEVGAALLATVPLLAGGILQLVTPYGVTRLKSRRRWVTAAAAIQAASFLPLVAGALLGRFPGGFVFLMAALYWGAGMSTGPAWNVWVEQLVPKPIRARFFSQRTWASQIGILTGLLGGGAALQQFAHEGHAVRGFALLFGIAAACRFGSARLLSRQSEPHPPMGGEVVLGARDLFQRIRSGRGGRLLLTLVFLTGAVAIVSAFFTPYMLVELGFTYTQYMLLIGISFGAKILTLPGLGRLASRLGAQGLLRAGAAGVVAIPFLWLVSPDFHYLLAVQVLGGASWAALELAFFLLLFEAIPSAERTSLLVAYNLANAMAMVAGSLLGSAVFEGMGTGLRGYRTLFLVSGVARLVASLLLVRGMGLRGRGMRLVLRSVAVRPSAGSLGRPILAALGSALRPRRSGSS